MNIYVANINFRANEDNLREVFEEYGQVKSVKIIMDKMTGRSRGFGFVEMDNDDEARMAISQLNGYSLMEKNLVVNEARERENNGGGGGGYNRGGGGGGYNRGGSGGGYNRGGGNRY